MILSLRALTLLPLFAIAGAPMFMAPQALPVARLVAAMQPLLDKNPKDHSLHYKMARLHYLALANDSTLVPGWETRSEGPEPAPPYQADGFLGSLRYVEANRRARAALGFDEHTKMDQAKWQELTSKTQEEELKLEQEKWHPEAPTADQLQEHAAQAMRHFDRAIELAPDNGLYRLGRVSLVEQCLEYERAGKLPRRSLIAGMAKADDTWLRDEYFATFELAFTKDSERDGLPIQGVSGLVSHEAGEAFLRLAGKSDKLGAGQKDRIATVRKGLEVLKKLPRGPITPIVVGRPGQVLADLLAPDATACFDLDGDGVAEDWPWLRPDTALLAWDPAARGAIESGRQLFGSVTFFLFHRDGYEALQLLDDDGDGELTDLELDGLVLWRDRDGDGIAQPSEVTPVWREGIVGLGTRGRRGPDGVLHAPRGVRYAHGGVAPTYDWVVQRCEPALAPR